MSDELIKRLREFHELRAPIPSVPSIATEAADLIEQQAARIAALEAQLATVAPAVDALTTGAVAWETREQMRERLNRKVLEMSDNPNELIGLGHEHHFVTQPSSGISVCATCGVSEVAARRAHPASEPKALTDGPCRGYVRGLANRDWHRGMLMLDAEDLCAIRELLGSEAGK
jgi:hypothetical protein